MSKNKSLKDLDAWIEVFVIDPITLPLVRFCSRYVSSNALFYTALSFLSGIMASVLLFLSSPVLAGVSYFFSMFFDGLDGKVGRYSGNYKLYHGIMDVTVDTVKNLTLLFSMFYLYEFSRIPIMIFLILFAFYEFTYSVRLELNARYSKIFSNPEDYSMANIKKRYDKMLGRNTNPLLSFAVKLYNGMFFYTRKLRTYPNPTLVDAEFVIFVLFPVFMSPVLLYVAILFILPDMLISFILMILLVKKYSRK